MRASRLLVWPALAACAAAAAACSSTSGEILQFNYDRPTDMAFGCVGFAIDGDGGVDTRTSVAVPLSECAQSTASLQDAGLPAPALVGLAVESTRGELVIANLNNGDVVDSDPLTPGHNGLTVGRLPSAADTTPDGCHIVVANSGSCDLSIVDVFAASAPTRTDDLFNSGASRRLLVNATGGPLAAAPTFVATPPSQASRTPCGTDPIGHAYVVYPECHLVARVELATGNIVDSLSFPVAGPPVAGGADVTCPVECREIASPAAGAPTGGEPTVVVVDPDGTRLYASARDHSSLYIVELVAGGGFGAVTEVPLEGAIGITRLAVTDDIEMGQEGVSGVHRFVYAIGVDQAVHVVEVHPALTPTECDTQIDPRYLHDFTDVSRLPCFPVGDAANPPRRLTARGPGMRLPDNATPTDISFVTGDTVPIEFEGNQFGDQPHPFVLNGVFAVVLGRDQVNQGVAYLFNVDDDNYPDIEDFLTPARVDMTLALPHTLRDVRPDRLHSLTGKCSDGTLALADRGPVRLAANVTVTPSGLSFNRDVGVNAGEYVPGTELPTRVQPMIHLELCETLDPQGNVANVDTVFQISAFAPTAVREKVFADLQSTPNENWAVIWEGPLAFSPLESIRTGQIVQVDLPNLELEVVDPTASFCEQGVEERDIVQLIGCANEGDCGVGEACVFHPEAPAGQTGMCLPNDDVDRLSIKCRALLVSERKYLIKAVPGGGTVRKDRLTLVPKASTLRSTPVDGCVSDAQCVALYEFEQDELTAATGIQQPKDQAWDCRPDAGYGGPARCIATCPDNRDDQCPSGSVCQDLVCIEGAFVPQECVAPAQQVEVSAGGAFVVLGSVSGYLHDRIVDPGTGICVDDPAAHPLQVGRFHPVEPACDADDEVAATGPNPCSVELAEPLGVRATDGTVSFGERKSRGIRFRGPGLRLDFADVITVHPGRLSSADPVNQAIAGTLQAAYPDGFAFEFGIAGGFANAAYGLGGGLPVRGRRSPAGDVWIVDAGDHRLSNGLVVFGQLMKLTQFGITAIIQ